MQPSKSTIRKRIQYGWEREQSKEIPLLYNRYNTSIVDSKTISKRLNKGWSYERATTTPKQSHGGKRVLVS